MCLILFSWDQTNHELVLAANRDEFHDRPTSKAHFWNDQSGILGGKDDLASGTWIGIRNNMRLAALTNYRSADSNRKDAPSRGNLTTDFLRSNLSPKEYLLHLKEEKLAYNGFNLLLSDGQSLWYYNNINHSIKELSTGIYGLSNGLLNDSWHKVEKGKEGLKKLIDSREASTEKLLNILTNTELAKTEQLPNTGFTTEHEKALSPINIQLKDYGTRCSTVIIRDKEQCKFVEKSYKVGSQEEGVVEFRL